MRDVPGLVYLILTPVLIIAVASFALSGLFDDSSSKLEIPLVVEDEGVYAKQLVSELNEVSAIKLITTYEDRDGNERPLTREKAETLVSDTKAAIIIPEGYSDNIKENNNAKVLVIADPVDQVVPEIVYNILSEYTASYSIGIVANQVGISALYELSNRIAAENNLKVDPSAEIQSVQSNVEKYVRNHPVSVEVTPLQMDSDVPETTPFQSNVPGYAVMFVLLGTASSALTLLEERANGTLRKLLTLPISKFSILGGKMLSNFITAVIQSSILFVIGHFVFGMWLGNSIAGLALLIGCTAFAATGLAMLIAALAKTRAQANGISILLILTMSALGGSWWPSYIMPEWMQMVSHVTVTAWAMDGFNALLTYGKGIGAIVLPALVLFGMGAVFLFLAVRRFRFQ